MAIVIDFMPCAEMAVSIFPGSHNGILEWPIGPVIRGNNSVLNVL